MFVALVLNYFCSWCVFTIEKGRIKNRESGYGNKKAIIVKGKGIKRVRNINEQGGAREASRRSLGNILSQGRFKVGCRVIPSAIALA